MWRTRSILARPPCGAGGSGIKPKARRGWAIPQPAAPESPHPVLRPRKRLARLARRLDPPRRHHLLGNLVQHPRQRAPHQAERVVQVPRPAQGSVRRRDALGAQPEIGNPTSEVVVRRRLVLLRRRVGAMWSCTCTAAPLVANRPGSPAIHGTSARNPSGACADGGNAVEPGPNPSPASCAYWPFQPVSTTCPLRCVTPFSVVCLLCCADWSPPAVGGKPAAQLTG